jgi:2-enoate reductase
MRLFEQGKIGKLLLKNRIIMEAMGTRLEEPDGRLSERDIDYYVARARGGAGLIITAASAVEREIEKRTEGPWSPLFRTDKPMYIDRFSRLANAVHDHGAKLAVQLTAGFGLNIPPEWIVERGVAPSEQPCLFAPDVMARELTVEEIEGLVNAFGFAANILSLAGVDAVEIHGQGGYLIDDFMTPLWNHRTDKYGGNLSRRLKFPLDIVKAIKASVGKDFPVTFRYSIRHDIEGGREVEESLEIARRLEEAGVDAINASFGCYGSRYGRQYPTYNPPGQWVELSEAVKKVVKIPVIVVGRLGYPELAEKVLQEGKADFIGLGRPLLADPEWPNKVREGRLDDILMCTGCNDGCMVRTREHKYISCALNPATGMEREFSRVVPAERRKSVLVVGGGPAGMEAARVAALRGHEVSLWEKRDQLGGNLVAASVPEFKQDVRSLIRYLSTQIKRLGVRIELGKEVTPELIGEMKPEVLVIATGATSVLPEIPGIKKGLVVTAVDLLLGKKEVGERVVVAGGSSMGCEVGLYLAQKGKKVTIVEMMGDLASDLFADNRTNLLQLLVEHQVSLLTETRLIEVLDTGVVVDGGMSKRELKADTVVLALGLKSEVGLLRALGGKGPEPIVIGDCVQPGKIIDAIWGGFRTARLI